MASLPLIVAAAIACAAGVSWLIVRSARAGRPRSQEGERPTSASTKALTPARRRLRRMTAWTAAATVGVTVIAAWLLAVSARGTQRASRDDGRGAVPGEQLGQEWDGLQSPASSPSAGSSGGAGGWFGSGGS